MQKKHREEEKKLSKLYQDSSVSGLTFSEFIEQQRPSTWKKLSMNLSDNELKMGKLAVKLSDNNLRGIMKKKEELI